MNSKENMKNDIYNIISLGVKPSKGKARLNIGLASFYIRSI